MSKQDSSFWAKFTHHSTFWFGVILAIVLIFFALLINSTRFISNLVLTHKPDIEAWVEKTLHQPISIGGLQESWQRFEPVISLRDVKIYNTQKTQILLQVNQLDMGVDVFDTLLHGRLYLGRLIIRGTNIELEQDQMGRFSFRGLQTTSATQTQA